jgi:hypothetical protein
MLAASVPSTTRWFVALQGTIRRYRLIWPKRLMLAAWSGSVMRNFDCKPGSGSNITVKI